MCTEGRVIERVSRDRIDWNWFNPNASRVISPKFRLPNCKNGDVDCHLFLDRTQKKIGIKNVSQDLGTVLISGRIRNLGFSGKEGKLVNFILKYLFLNLYKYLKYFQLLKIE